MHGKDVRKIRLKINMTQNRFAQLLGCSIHLVRRWEYNPESKINKKWEPKLLEIDNVLWATKTPKDKKDSLTTPEIVDLYIEVFRKHFMRLLPAISEDASVKASMNILLGLIERKFLFHFNVEEKDGLGTISLVSLSFAIDSYLELLGDKIAPAKKLDPFVAVKISKFIYHIVEQLRKLDIEDHIGDKEFFNLRCRVDKIKNSKI